MLRYALSVRFRIILLESFVLVAFQQAGLIQRSSMEGVRLEMSRSRFCFSIVQVWRSFLSNMHGHSNACAIRACNRIPYIQTTILDLPKCMTTLDPSHITQYRHQTQSRWFD